LSAGSWSASKSKARSRPAMSSRSWGKASAGYSRRLWSQCFSEIEPNSSRDLPRLYDFPLLWCQCCHVSNGQDFRRRDRRKTSRGQTSRRPVGGPDKHRVRFAPFEYRLSPRKTHRQLRLASDSENTWTTANQNRVTNKLKSSQLQE
jgi:hypothetical protein